MLAQDAHGLRIQGDPATAALSLRLAELDPIVDVHDGLPDLSRALIHVRVPPPDAKHLATPHRGHGSQVVAGEVPVASDALEERPELFGRPRRHVPAARLR